MPTFLIPGLIVLAISSICVNFYMLSSQFDDEQENNKSKSSNLNINCSESSVNYIVNEWFLSNDGRFNEQENNFTPKDYFPILEYNNITRKEIFDFNNFYTRHLAFNYPFILRGEAKKWKAIRKWRNETYLLKKIGNLTISVEKKPQGSNEFAYFKKDFNKTKMKYNKFVEYSQNYKYEPYIYYWAEQKLPKTLQKDIIEPKFGHLMNLEEIHIWQSSAGTISLPHTDSRDNFLCQILGNKEIILIPPTQRNLLYIDDIMEKKKSKRPKNYSPVNFFEPNYEKYPDFSQIRGKMYVKLEEGDLLYIPSFWWHHVKSSKNTNIAVNFWYTPNFMVESLFGGIQNNFYIEEN